MEVDRSRGASQRATPPTAPGEARKSKIRSETLDLRPFIAPSSPEAVAKYGRELSAAAQSQVIARRHGWPTIEVPKFAFELAIARHHFPVFLDFGAGRKSLILGVRGSGGLGNP